MKKVIKNLFERKQKSVVSILCIVFIVASGCRKSNSTHENNEEQTSSLNNNTEEPMTQQEICDVFPWGVRLKLKPQEDESYFPTKDPKIKDLLSKHGLGMRQTYPGPKSTPELLLYYTLTIDDFRECRGNYVNDFLATGRFEDDFNAYEEVHPANIYNNH